MKSKILCAFLLAGSIASASVQAEVHKDVTGLEWLELSIGERMDQLLASMLVLTQHGVPLRQALNDYYNLVDERLKKNPGYYGMELTNLLAQAVYENEEGTRGALDKYRETGIISKINRTESP